MAVIPVFRPSARVIVSDDRDRILLFSFADTGGRTGWFTPGGGMRGGETAAAAAVRELAEETGLTVAESDVGQVVAMAAGLWALPQLVTRLLADGPPEHPVRLPWRVR